MNNRPQLIPSRHSVAASFIILSTILLPALCISALGCGDSDADGESRAGAVTGRQAGGGGRIGASAGIAGGTQPPPPPVPCGSNACSPPANSFSAVLNMFGMGGSVSGLPSSVSCCLDAKDGTCGTAASEDAKCEGPATPDPRCPGLDLGALGALAGAATTDDAGAMAGSSMQGCCTSDNMCGQDGAAFGRGCIENGEVKKTLGSLPVIGSLIMFQASFACDRPIEGN